MFVSNLVLQDFILNGQPHGPVATELAGCHYDPNLMRPFQDEKGRMCVLMNVGKDSNGKPKLRKYLASELISKGIPIPVNNALALRKDQWIELDRQIVTAARLRMRAWGDLISAGLTTGGFNAMGKSIYEYEKMSDPGTAQVDMEGLADNENDQPRYTLQGIPLPITSSGFFFSARKLAISRNDGTPLNSVLAESAGERVAETIEQTLIGTLAGHVYGASGDYAQTSKVYGYTNFPGRVTKTDLTAPTGSNGTTVLGEWLTIRDLLYANKQYGPFIVYTSDGWDRYLDDEFKTNSDKTLRQRLLECDGISAIRRLDYLTQDYQLLFVSMNKKTVSAINGMPITTIQWESRGGMQLNFKVMAIQVPLIRDDFNGSCGIAHARTASLT